MTCASGARGKRGHRCLALGLGGFGRQKEVGWFLFCFEGASLYLFVSFCFCLEFVWKGDVLCHL